MSHVTAAGRRSPSSPAQLGHRPCHRHRLCQPKAPASSSPTLPSEPLEGGEATLELIAAPAASPRSSTTDVGNWEDVDALIGSTVARYGRLDVMVNNAAIYSGTALLDTTSSAVARGHASQSDRHVQRLQTRRPADAHAGAAAARCADASSISARSRAS